MDRGVSIIDALIAPHADGWRLDRALADAVPTLSRERLKALISSGAVTGPAGLVRDPATKIRGGTAFSVAVPAPAPAHNEAQEIALEVAYEDEHLIVIDKPAGLVVHPAAGNLDGTLVNALLHHCRGSLSGIGGVERPGIVHRIDKDTSGLMVAAKTDRAHEGLARQFADHSIERRYKAIVAGRPMPSAGLVDAPLARSATNRKKVAIVAGGKRAVTHYRTLEPLRDAALIECGWKRGARIRCACTWPRSATRCWATQCTDGRRRAINPCWKPLVSDVRPCTRRGSGSSTRSQSTPCRSKAKCLPICRNCSACFTYRFL